MKPQDVVVLLKLAAHPDLEWNYAGLAVDLGMSASEVHASLGRSAEGGLYVSERRSVNRRGLAEFLVHGLRYVFPAERGGSTRGIATAHAAAPLAAHFRPGAEAPPVWPDAKGDVRGEALAPLYRSVPHAARADPSLYELLALSDALRAGRARERELAAKEIERRLA